MTDRISHFPGRWIWILLVFMTILMGIPFLYYYKFSSFETDFLVTNRLRTGQFGMQLRSYLETFPFPLDTVAREWETIPLIPGIRVELYDEQGSLVSERSWSSFSLNENTGSSRSYQLVKRIFDSIRRRSEDGTGSRPETIREALLRDALKGQRRVDYMLSSGEIGNRVLYFSYPLRHFSHDKVEVKGALLLEYRDPSEAILLQKQRGQFAVMCLIFGFLFTAYVIYVLTVLVFPLRKLLRKLIALKNGTDYLLSDKDKIIKNNEIGAITRQLDSVSGLLNNREKEIEQYMTELKHIVRNPLTIIKVALEGLIMNRSTERDRSLSHIIQNNLAKIDMYISSYNPVSEIVGRDAPVENINIPLFLEEVVRNYEPLGERRGVHFELKEPDSAIIWRGFYAHLFYVMEQILNNAIDFSPERGGTIHLETYTGDKKVVIRIADQGPGLPLGKEDEIFLQYKSFRTQSDRNHSGTGLYLSRKVLEKIGGSVYGENKETGGAVFVILLPMDL